MCDQPSKNKNHMLMEEATCPICGPVATTPLVTFPSSGEGVAICAVRCAGCGHVYLSPRRSYQQTIATYQNAQSVSHFEKDRPLREFAATQYLERLEQRTRPGRLLDIGCGSGIFLDVARTRGWETYGTELTSACVQDIRTRGHIIFEGDLADADFEPASFDAVHTSYVFEHLHAPLTMAQNIRRLLRPGGIAMIIVPNFSTLSTHYWMLRHHLERAPIWDIPAHNHYFTAHSLTALFQKAGFTGTASATCMAKMFLWRRRPATRRFWATLLKGISWLPCSTDLVGTFIA